MEVYKIGKIITNYCFLIKQELLRSILLFSLEWNECTLIKHTVWKFSNSDYLLILAGCHFRAWIIESILLRFLGDTNGASMPEGNNLSGSKIPQG